MKIKPIVKTIGKGKPLVANPPALSKNKRFINSDLNRVFPGKRKGNVEEKLAYQIMKEIRFADYALDLHTCSSESDPFCIIRNKRILRQALKTKLSHFVLFPLIRQGGRSSIDFVKCGIGLELGVHDKKKTVNSGLKAVNNFLIYLEMIDGELQEKKSVNVFKIFGKLPKNKQTIPASIKNFSLIKKGRVLGRTNGFKIIAPRDFYPILFGERAYDNILTFVGKKVNINV